MLRESVNFAGYRATSMWTVVPHIILLVFVTVNIICLQPIRYRLTRKATKGSFRPSANGTPHWGSAWSVLSIVLVCTLIRDHFVWQAHCRNYKSNALAVERFGPSGKAPDDTHRWSIAAVAIGGVDWGVVGCRAYFMSISACYKLFLATYLT